MGLKSWVERAVGNVQKDGVSAGVREATYELYEGAWRIVGWHIPLGTNLYRFDWDALIILDACRVDLLEEVSDEYDFITNIESKTSVGSMSEEWMRKTFTDEFRDEIVDTAYVTANLFSNDALSKADFLVLDEVWRYGWDDELNAIPPEPVTNSAIKTGRKSDYSRLIVHYMQPHYPFLGKYSLDDNLESDPFGRNEAPSAVDALRQGKLSKTELWKAYRSNLRLVLDEVEVLLSNLDAENVVITADHGQAYGEWGIYGHPAGFLHPVVKQVPWVETTARDNGNYNPETSKEEVSNTAVSDRLRNLGYL